MPRRSPARVVAVAGFVLLGAISFGAISPVSAADVVRAPRERLPFGEGWRFERNDPPGASNGLAYETIRAYVLPTGDELLSAPGPHAPRPAGNPGGDVPCSRGSTPPTPRGEGSTCRTTGASRGPSARNSGETGKLPWAGVGWYRKRFTLPAADEGRQIQRR